MDGEGFELTTELQGDYRFPVDSAQPGAPRTTVSASLSRNEAGRLRARGIQARITPVVDAADHGRMRRCLELFEDFCVVAQSVRSGIEVDVAVEPVARLAASGDARAMGVPAG